MTFTQSIQLLQSLAVKKGINYSLEKLTPILNELNNPEKNLPTSIHIAGTNGKGSTTAFLKSLCLHTNKTVITFTSPHLSCYTERITYNDASISQKKFCELFNKIQPFLNDGLTEFEVLTLMALIYCAQQKPDVCIFEVGLGGRLDATNVINPTCCIITHIDYDHQQFLGTTLTQIALEKAGIMKQNIACFSTTNQHNDVKSSLISHAKTTQTPLTFISPLTTSEKFTHLNATYQKENASLAKAAFNYLFKQNQKSTLEDGLKKAIHWGRFSQFTHNNTNIIIDAAHNISGLTQLKKNLDLTVDYAKRTLVFGLHKNKDPQTLLPLISSLAPTLYYCEFCTQFAIKFSTIQTLTSTPIKPYTLNSTLPKANTLILTGSIYFIGNFHKSFQLTHQNSK